MSDDLPPCGIYRTVKKIGTLEEGRLVYFHNHGNPGPGVYFPERWNANRCTFSEKGMTLPGTWDTSALKPLPAEGFYRVAKKFVCCSKKCVTFEPEMLIQLGYNGAGKALLFVPELAGSSINVPEKGTPVDDDAFASIVKLTLPEREVRHDLSLPRGLVVH